MRRDREARERMRREGGGGLGWGRGFIGILGSGRYEKGGGGKIR